MRLIDADAIEYTHAVARNMFDGHNWNELVVTKDEIEDMPTIQPEITHEQAVAYLQSTGWMQEHDRQMMLDGVHRLTAQPEPHWIPVTERLPDKHGAYIVCYSDFRHGIYYGRVIAVAWFDVEDTWLKYRYADNARTFPPRLHHVIAWIPLPEPYKEVTE